MRIKNILQYFEATASRLGEKTAFSSGKGQENLTFSALMAQSRRIGSALLRRGLGGARVAVLMERSPRAIAAMLGIWYAGGVSVMVDISQPHARMQAMLSQVAISAALADAAHGSTATALLPNILPFDEMIDETADDDALALVRRRQIDTDPL